MSSSSHNSTISTYVYCKGYYYQCFDLTDRTVTSIGDVRTSIATALEISTLSPDDIIEIKTDDDDYVVLNNYYLVNKSPWKSYSNAGQLLPLTKKVYLRIAPKTEQESNTCPVHVSTTQFINETETNDCTTTSTTNKDEQTLAAVPEIDVEHKYPNNFNATLRDTSDNLPWQPNYNDLSDIERLRYGAQNSSPLKFIYDVSPKQRLVYPSGKDLVLIQTNKKIQDRKKSAPPVLQISTEYVDYIQAGGTVELVSAVVNKLRGHDQLLEYCLAPYRGFWPLDRASRFSKDKPFSNPLISPITLNQLQEMRTNAGESIYTTKLLLHLMHAVDAKYDQNPQQLVLLDEFFLLFGAQPVPSHYDFSPHRAIVTTNEHEILNKNECYIWCALRSDLTCDLYDWNSKCLSEMFIVESRPSSNVTKSINNPVSRKRSRSCLLNNHRKNAEEPYSN